MNPEIIQPDLSETQQVHGTHQAKPGLPGTPSDKRICLPPGFELLEEVGRGGMGVVYRVRDVSFDREVALKVLQPQLECHSQQALRFTDEARITGQLQHPGIPAVHQVGMLPDGKPYLVMKLIKGYTLSDIIWPKERATSGKNTSTLHVIPAQYLSIFEAICQAMGYAHAHHVIHRDLKPDNIMVGAFGEVQVMDWGLAKVLHPQDHSAVMEDPATDPELTMQYCDDTQIHTSGSQLTIAGSVLGTPAYMAPEQAVGANAKIDARADVFGLGAILCCILTGKPPFVGDHAESTRLLAAMGLLNDTFERLDASGAEPELIVLAKRCLAIKPEDRPENGETVAREVARLRAAADERVKQAELERTKATVQAEEQKQKRRMLLQAGAAIVTLLIVGIVGTTYGLFRANAKSEEAFHSAELEHRARLAEMEQRQIAQRKENEIVATLEFVESKLLSAARPLGLDQGLGRDITVAQAMKTALDSIGPAFEDKPLIEARIRLTIGRSFGFLGDLSIAMEQINKALALFTKHQGLESRESIIALLALANIQFQLDLFKEALEARERAFQISQKHFGMEEHVTQMAMSNLAISYENAKRDDDAMKLREQVLKLTRLHLGTSDPFTMLCMNNLAVLLFNHGRQNEAFELLEEAIGLQKKHLGETHPNTLETMSSKAECLAGMKKYQEALIIFNHVLESRQQKLGHNHPDTLQSMIDVSETLNSLGKQKEALKIVQEALPMFEERLGLNNGQTLYCISIIVNRLFDLHRQEEALPLMKMFFKRVGNVNGTSNLLNAMFANLCRYHRLRGDVLGFQTTLLDWEKRKPSGSNNLVEIALAWSSFAQLKKETDNTGRQEADQAMEHLQKAVEAGWKQVQQLETDSKFEFLRNRDDFRVLLNKLKKQLEQKP